MLQVLNPVALRWSHSVVASPLSQILQTPTASKYLTMEDRLAVLIAALCHDMDHDGRSNSFHMHTQSELARLYNDR